MIFFRFFPLFFCLALFHPHTDLNAEELSEVDPTQTKIQTLLKVPPSQIEPSLKPIEREGEINTDPIELKKVGDEIQSVPSLDSSPALTLANKKPQRLKISEIARVKPFAIIDTMESFGGFSTGDQQILFQHFNKLLSRWYHRFPNKRLSPESTLSMIPGLRRFHFQFSHDNSLVQIYLRMDLKDQQIKVETSCKICSMKEIQSKMDHLFLEIVRKDGVLLQKEVNQLMTKKRGLTSKLETNWPHHVTAISVALLSTWIAFDEADKHNRLVKENNSIKTSYSQSTSTSESNRLQEKIDENDSKIDKHKKYYQTFSLIALGAFFWEGYLIWKDSPDNKPIDSSGNYALYPQQRLDGLTITYTQRF